MSLKGTINEVEGYGTADRVVVEFPNQYGCQVFCGTTDLIPPSGLICPTRFVSLAFNRMAWYLNITKVRALILIEITLARNIQVVRREKIIQAIDNLSFKRRALLA